MRKFLNNVSDALQIGVRNDEGEILGQGAIVTFSERATVQINLKASDKPGAFKKKVKDMPGPLVGGRTKTDLALQMADKDVLKQSAGYREDDSDVAKILVVITDGEQTKGSRSVYVGEAIKPFFQRDMTVFAIGVGLQKESAKQEILDMVEESTNALFPTSYTALINEVNNFIRRFCPGTCIYLFIITRPIIIL